MNNVASVVNNQCSYSSFVQLFWTLVFRFSLSIYTELIKVKVIINVFTVLSVVKYSPVVLYQIVVTEQIGLVESCNILFQLP